MMLIREVEGGAIGASPIHDWVYGLEAGRWYQLTWHMDDANLRGKTVRFLRMAHVLTPSEVVQRAVVRPINNDGSLGDEMFVRPACLIPWR